MALYIKTFMKEGKGDTEETSRVKKQLFTCHIMSKNLSQMMETVENDKMVR
jgi:hypothetical protein